MKYRKKPVVIEAWHNVAKMHLDNTKPDWLLSSTKVHFYPSGFIIIDTLEGQMRADLNDWIIQGVKGEIYPCKPDIFAATYEAVEEPEIKEGDHQLNINWE